MQRRERGSFHPGFGAALVLVLAFTATTASAEPATFGSRTLEVPAPDGFVSVSRDLPQYLEFQQAFLPESNRLVEAYLPPAAKVAMATGNAVTLPRYFQLQVMRQVDGTPVAEADFSGAMGAMEAQIVAIAPTLDAEAKRLSERGNSAAGDAGVSIGDTKYLGVFRREPWGLFFTASGAVKVADSGKTDSQRIITASGVVLVDQQVIYLYGFANEADPDARAWAERSVAAWADAIRVANGAAPVAAAAPAITPEAVATSDTSSAGMSRALLIGGLLGLLVIVVIVVLLRRKSS